jgi:hypothetical protein
MFEEQLEGFCKKMNITQVEFMRKCKSAASIDKRADHYIQILLSSVEFETFLKLMKIMRPIAIQKLKAIAIKAESKSSGSGGAGKKGGGGGGAGPARRKAAKDEPDLEFDKEVDNLDIPDNDSQDLEMEDMTADAKGKAWVSLAK